MSVRYVIAVGAACVDEYYEADSWPRLGDKGLVRPTGEVVGGMIANAACVLAGYGVDTRMFDSMNRRQAGFILKDLASYGLDVSRVRLDDNLPDAKCIIVRSGEDRAILVVDNAAAGDCPWPGRTGLFRRSSLRLHDAHRTEAVQEMPRGLME